MSKIAYINSALHLHDIVQDLNAKSRVLMQFDHDIYEFDTLLATVRVSLRFYILLY
jgi:hypothetical protein